MIRTLMAASVAAASLAAGSAALAQSYAYDDLGGVVIEGQPRDAYVMRVTTAGKTDHQVRSEIHDVARIACNRAPRTGNTLETRPSQVLWCANEAEHNALQQFDVMAKARRHGAFVDVAAYTPYD